jgi:hypothetical protein
MVEQGLVALIQAGLGNPPLAPGGFAVKLPENYISATNPMAWTYRSILAEPSYLLAGQDGLTGWHVQIDCHGNSMSDAIHLARTIDGVLRGSWSGVLPDPDATVVQGIFRQGPAIDGYSDTAHSYVRTLEYLVNYEQI